MGIQSGEENETIVMIRARLGSLEVGEGRPVAVMGVINLSPDSFYPGSVRKPGDVRKRAERMIEEGADIIDVGAFSTRPGARQISAQQELKRLMPALKELESIGVPISVDTQRAEVAEAALGQGAEIVNDVSGLKASPEMARVISRHGASAIVMASWVRPGELLLARQKGGERIASIQGVLECLRESLEIARRGGLQESRIVVDPGIGFSVGPLTSAGQDVLKGDWYERDVVILAKLGCLRELGRPICVGVSRKSFIGRILNLPDPADRLAGSIAATVLAVANGAHVIRTHDVRETVHAIRIAEEILKVS